VGLSASVWVEVVGLFMGVVDFVNAFGFVPLHVLKPEMRTNVSINMLFGIAACYFRESAPAMPITSSATRLSICFIRNAAEKVSQSGCVLRICNSRKSFYACFRSVAHHPKLIPFYDRAERAVWAARLRNPFLLARAIPNTAGFIELYPWPLHVYRDLTETKAAKLATGLVSIDLQQDEHLSRREANRRNYSIGDQVANKARHSLGNGLRGSRLRHPTFQRIFGRAENARGGWTFAETPLNAISRSQLEPRVSRSEAAVQSAS
jgi:hypothetical protein